jgi:hypothetical protein
MKGFMLVVALAVAEEGVQDECISGVMHKVKYTMSEERDEDNMPRDFTVSVAPAHDEDYKCASNGITTRNVCVGVNTEDCKSATEAKIISSFLTCESCFAGFTTDFFYDVEVSLFKLQKLAMGFQNTKLVGAAEMHARQSAGKLIEFGSFPLLGDKVHNISFTVKDTIPVDIGFKLPTSLKYNVTLSDNVDLTFGGDLAFDLGDHSVQWTPEKGWEIVSTDKGLSWNPVVSANGRVSAGLPLALSSQLVVNGVSGGKFADYSLDMVPGLPSLQAEYKHRWLLSDQICASSDANVTSHHQGRLHTKILGKDVTIASFGPQTLYENHWDKIFEKCVDIGSTESLV